MSLLEFEAIEYKRKGNAVASEEQLARIAKVPKREFIRRGINQHTLEKICRREPVRAVKLEKCLKALDEYERGSPRSHFKTGQAVVTSKPANGPHPGQDDFTVSPSARV